VFQRWVRKEKGVESRIRVYNKKGMGWIKMLELILELKKE